MMEISGSLYNNLRRTRVDHFSAPA